MVKIRAWRRKDKAFIRLMKTYENNDAFESENQKEVWQCISKEAGMPGMLTIYYITFSRYLLIIIVCFCGIKLLF